MPSLLTNISKIIFPRKSILTPCGEAVFSCAEIRNLLNQNFPTIALAGVIFVPVIENGEQTFELRGVYFSPLIHNNMLEYGGARFIRPVNKKNFLNVSTTYRQKLREFRLVFFHRSVFDFIVNYDWQSGKFKHIHVSRVIVDNKNGVISQNLKIRPEPDPKVQGDAEQISSVSYSIGVSCPPTWIPAKKDDYHGYAGTAYYVNGSNIGSLDITKQMLIDLVNKPIDPPGPND